MWHALSDHVEERLQRITVINVVKRDTSTTSDVIPVVEAEPKGHGRM